MCVVEWVRERDDDDDRFIKASPLLALMGDGANGKGKPGIEAHVSAQSEVLYRVQFARPMLLMAPSIGTMCASPSLILGASFIRRCARRWEWSNRS